MKKAVLASSFLFLIIFMMSISSAFCSTDPTQIVNRLHIKIIYTTGQLNQEWMRLTLPDHQMIVNSLRTCSDATNAAACNYYTLSGAGADGIAGNYFSIWNQSASQQTVVDFDVLVSDDGLSNNVWTISKSYDGSATVQITNTNDKNSPVLIANYTDSDYYGKSLNFQLSPTDLYLNGPLSPGTFDKKRVFAQYYPWWGNTTGFNYWTHDSNPLADFPIDRSTGLPNKYNVSYLTDVENIVNNAKFANLDGFFVSYQGDGSELSPTVQANFAYLPYVYSAAQMLITAANQQGNFSVAAAVETRVGNYNHCQNYPADSSCLPDPSVLKKWIKDIVNNFAGGDNPNPAYLRVEKKLPDGTIKNVPVIWIYWAETDDSSGTNMTGPQWWEENVFAPLESQGIYAFYIADSAKTSYLGSADHPAFDGLNSYNPSTFTNIPSFTSRDLEITKTYNLLNDVTHSRKLWMGTSVPGVDTTDIGGSTQVSRYANGGSLGDEYKYLWDQNINNSLPANYLSFSDGTRYSPDWMIITSWNEYYENTHIEPSNNYGNTFLNLTRNYAYKFKYDDFNSPAITTLTPAEFSTVNSPTITASFADFGSGVDQATASVSLDGTAMTGCTVTATNISCPASGLADRVHTYTVSVSDNAGNTATSSGSFTVDTTPPAISALSPSNYIKTTTNSISASLSDGGSGINTSSGSVVVQIQPFGNMTTTVQGCTVTNTQVSCPAGSMAPGGYHLTVTAHDNAGNSSTATGTFYIDTTAPDLSNLQPIGPISTTTATISFGYYDPLVDYIASGINLGSISVQLDGNNLPLSGCVVQSTSVSCPVSGLTAGYHSIGGSAADYSGNTSTIGGQFLVSLP